MYEDKEELAITPDLIKTFSNEFKSDPVAQISMNACWKCDPIDICLKREKLYETNHVFTHKVESEGKPVTHQKSTGRCWIFASLNAMRIPFMKSLNIEEFEFSQAYLFFWDKLIRTSLVAHDPTCIDAGEGHFEYLLRFLNFEKNDSTDDVLHWVCLVNDPRPKNEYSKTFTVDCLGNMVNGRVIIYNNQPIEVLMKYAAESIKSGEAVWFGCEVSKRFASKLGIQDIDVYV
ncbi:Bleomycin hydrolase [Armadillidium vulgare]|nr:Bleomycin hydrolase [Armadillidium vulgare]